MPPARLAMQWAFKFSAAQRLRATSATNRWLSDLAVAGPGSPAARSRTACAPGAVQHRNVATRDHAAVLTKTSLLTPSEGGAFARVHIVRFRARAARNAMQFDASHATVTDQNRGTGCSSAAANLLEIGRRLDLGRAAFASAFSLCRAAASRGARNNTPPRPVRQTYSSRRPAACAQAFGIIQAASKPRSATRRLRRRHPMPGASIAPLAHGRVTPSLQPLYKSSPPSTQPPPRLCTAAARSALQQHRTPAQAAAVCRTPSAAARLSPGATTHTWHAHLTTSPRPLDSTPCAWRS